MIITTKIDGEFSGFDDSAVFRLTNGQVWQQARYRYRYHYAYRPDVRIVQQGGQHFMEVPCMGDRVEVRPAQVLCQGVIVSDFEGFDGESVFEFNNGQVWKQSAYKYSYHYAYRPEAMVVDGHDGIVLTVEGMSDTVQVRRVR